MKKRNLKSLKLNKKSISDLNTNNSRGGAEAHNAHQALNAFTGGCSDGCDIFKSWWNCTRANCTADCGTVACDTEAFCTF